MTALRIAELRPYRAYTLAKICSGTSMERAAADVIGEVTNQIEDRGGVQIVRRLPWVAEHRAGFMHYRVEHTPGWTSSTEITDLVNELVLVTAHRSHVAVYSSEDQVKKKLLRTLRDREDGSLPSLTLVEPWRLEIALLLDNEQRTLWLSGIHRRTASKADSKVLSGLDLRLALNALDDQSYSYTAARASASIRSVEESVGVAPRKGGVWVGVAKSWVEHRDTARAILEMVANAASSDAAVLPVLAQPAPDGVDLAQLEAPFDAAFIPPELMDTTNDEAASAVAEILERCSITPGIRDGGRVELRVSLPESGAAELVYVLEPDLSNPLRVRWAVERVGEPPDALIEVDSAMFDTLRTRPSWLKVWFESGYVLSDCSLFRARHRDLPFEGWQWADFNQYDVKKEKPHSLLAEEIGNDDSLFCWVANQVQLPWANTLGWLASNDGSMEIADFIHVDPHERVLTLVHVKGAGSSSAGRGVSVSSYEIVVGQAVKNLRHVDQELLAGGFLQSLDRRLKAAVWHDGEFLGEAGRSPMKRAIQNLGMDFRRQVVILQPHVRRSALDQARGSSSSRLRLRAQQLDTLLLGARASCQAVGAELIVLGEDG